MNNIVKIYPRRTLKSNSALHLWFSQIANLLTDAGYEQQITIGTADVPWSEKTVKSAFKSIGRVQFEKAKTSEMTTKELSEVAETFIRFYASRGLVLPAFPSMEALLQDQDSLTN